MNITQWQLAEHIGCDAKVINRIVNGRTSISVELAIRLARALNTSPEFWLNAQDGAIDPRSVRVLDTLPHDIVCIEVAAGRWTAMSVWNTASGGNIRGVFPEEEDGSLTAPPAGDILNPDAVACFLRLTHDRYYAHLGRHRHGQRRAVHRLQQGPG